MTKGQMEAKLSEIITKFEIDIMGRGPKQINTTIVKDMIVIRQKGFFSESEKRLAKTNNGVELLKKLRTILFENEEGQFKKMIEEIIEQDIISIHSDVSTRTGEKIIVLTVATNLEELFNK